MALIQIVQNFQMLSREQDTIGTFTLMTRKIWKINETVIFLESIKAKAREQ
jgi:hypothetical protein